MRSVKGIYDGEKIKLLEKVEQQKPCHVIITFMEDESDIDKLRQYPADEDAFDFWLAEEDLYQDYVTELNHSIQEAESGQNLISFTMEEFMTYSPKGIKCK